MATANSKNDEQQNIVNKSEEEEDIVNLNDIVREEDQLEEDARAVLGGADARICTYDEGYLKRQPLYSCKSCGSGAICLACSFECHDTHDLVELYTKRNTRCDCGNSKVPGKCQLRPDKAEKNEENTYNHNYDGVYCICSRPYPDPEDTSEDEMVQCVICEDWHHTRHLNGDLKGSIISPNSYSEVTCKGCVEKHTFLIPYITHYESSKDTETEEALDVEGCILDELKKKSKSSAQAVFWREGWRNGLCRCQNCKKTYTESGIGFLLDPEDSVQAYEEKAKTRTASEEGNLNRALENMSRVQQNEVLAGYNNMKTKLGTFLKEFAEKRKTVEAKDIQEFFKDLNNKRRRTDIPPNTCK
ncbi:DgyrCDS9926 [Dimorphilus gyrociliatus]|uniref:DgyrCDS9926 n=1 Tax=Dimorphilus gyrociliatus TaxID=2664684 RepID=A0A7I8VYJ9_9ANNE|nr:DgyrCDS9926 [Dimorphilus gyrociliatus]